MKCRSLRWIFGRLDGRLSAVEVFNWPRAAIVAGTWPQLPTI